MKTRKIEAGVAHLRDVFGKHAEQLDDFLFLQMPEYHPVARRLRITEQLYFGNQESTLGVFVNLDTVKYTGVISYWICKSADPAANVVHFPKIEGITADRSSIRSSSPSAKAVAYPIFAIMRANAAG
jgi:hypothetical protein